MSELTQPPLDPEAEYALLQSDFQDKLAANTRRTIQGGATFNPDITAQFARLFRDMFGEPTFG